MSTIRTLIVDAQARLSTGHQALATCLQIDSDPEGGGGPREHDRQAARSKTPPPPPSSRAHDSGMTENEKTLWSTGKPDRHRIATASSADLSNSYQEEPIPDARSGSAKQRPEDAAAIEKKKAELATKTLLLCTICA